MYLYGASGHAKVIIDIIKAQGGVLEGLVDDNPNLKELNGTPILHDATGLSPFIISIGNSSHSNHFAYCYHRRGDGGNARCYCSNRSKDW